ncbi:unnamed protein product [Boreogadus saida]
MTSTFTGVGVVMVQTPASQQQPCLDWKDLTCVMVVGLCVLALGAGALLQEESSSLHQKLSLRLEEDKKGGFGPGEAIS